MPAPKYVDAVRRHSSSQSKELPQRQAYAGRGNATPAATAQRPAPLPHDPRFIYTFAVAVKSGVEFEGILHGPVLGSKNIHLTLKNARRLNDAVPSGKEVHETLIIPANEFVQMRASGIPVAHFGKSQNGIEIATNPKDTEGSKTGSECTNEKVEYEVLPVPDENDMSGFSGDLNRAAVAAQTGPVERPLVAWNGGGGAEGEDVLLEAEGSTGGWCQFDDHVNRDVRSTFDMETYTSKLDVSQSKYTEEDAERIAAEIQNTPKTLPALDDSGERDEELPPPVREEAPAKPKPFSWVDAVKRNTASQPAAKSAAPEATVARLPAERRETETVQPQKARQNVSAPVESPPPPQTSRKVQQDDGQAIPAKQDSAQETFKYESCPTSFFAQPDMAAVPAYVHPEDGEAVFRSGGYPLSGRVESPAAVDHPSEFPIQAKDVSVDKAPQYYSDPVWGPPPVDEALPVKPNVNAPPQPQEPFDQGFPEAVPSEGSPVSAGARKPEVKKSTSAVVPGISFRDKLKANMPVATPKTVVPIRQRSPRSTGHAQTKSQCSLVDPANDPVVQSPRQRPYSEKLITNPRRNELHPGDGHRGLPSEEHLLSPMTLAQHPMIYSPMHETGPGSVAMMPHPMPHAIYPDMPHRGPPPRGPFGSFGPPPMPRVPGPHPDGVPMMPPPPAAGPGPHYMPPPHAAFPPHVERPVHEDGELDSTGRGRRHFQLNPMAKAFKPVVSLEGSPSAPEAHPSASYAQPPPLAEYEPKASSQSGELPPPVLPPPPTEPMPPQQQTPEQPPIQGDAPPAEFVGNPPAPGPRPPFLPPRNVVTPWPSFPGTGVWHSGLGTPRPGTQANAMMNGFMPPGLPGPYPMFVPGMPPPHFMGGMQDPMWRPHPMPPGIPDQQSLAMMWGNYYRQLVPPNQRVWNPQKFSGPAGPMSRQGRSHRRPSNSQGPPPNFVVQSPATQPSGEMP